MLTVITLISDYLKGKIKSFEHAALALLTNDKTILMKFLGNKTQRDTDIEHISKRFSFTTADNVDVNHNEQPLQIDDEALNTLLQEDDHTTTNNNKEFNHLYKTIPRKDNFPNSKWRGLITSEKDKAIFNDIDNIVAEFSLFFPNHTEQEILKALKNNSFDISLTYLYLSDPTEFEYLTFTDVDDYVVKNMKNSDHYQRLIEEKGEYVVQERIKFFNLEEEII